MSVRTSHQNIISAYYPYQQTDLVDSSMDSLECSGDENGHK